MVMKNMWNSSQVELVLRSVLQRLKTAPSSFNIKVEGNEVKIDNIRGTLRTGNPIISIVLYKRDWSIYLNLDDNADIWRPSFWGNKSDKNVKELFEQIVEFSRTKGITTEDIILKCFPEAVDIEIEKTVLVDKIPKG